MKDKILLQDSIGMISPELIENAQKHSAIRAKRFRSVAVAAAFIGIISICIPLILKLSHIPDQTDKNTDGTSVTDKEPQADEPDGKEYYETAGIDPSPKIYGNTEETANSSNDSIGAFMSATDFSVVAKAQEILPDVYIAYGLSNRTRFQLVKMKTLAPVKPNKMLEYFYYAVPVEYMTDYTAYDKLYIDEFCQFSYEHCVLYNETSKSNDTIDLPIFGNAPFVTSKYVPFTFKSVSIIAYDKNGNIDLSLWRSNEELLRIYKALIEEIESDDEHLYRSLDNLTDWVTSYPIMKKVYYRLLSDYSQFTAELEEYIKNPECGSFTSPFSEATNITGGSVYVNFRKYLNGFATNEYVKFQGKQDPVYSEAKFTKEDLVRLPMLNEAYSDIVNKVESGEISHSIVAPDNYERTHGVFGWYAKTNDGIYGCVRVSFTFKEPNSFGLFEQDRYFVVLPGARSYVEVTNLELLDLVGRDTNFIFMGPSTEFGKVFRWWDKGFDRDYKG